MYIDLVRIVIIIFVVYASWKFLILLLKNVHHTADASWCLPCTWLILFIPVISYSIYTIGNDGYHEYNALWTEAKAIDAKYRDIRINQSVNSYMKQRKISIDLTEPANFAVNVDISRMLRYEAENKEKRNLRTRIEKIMLHIDDVRKDHDTNLKNNLVLTRLSKYGTLLGDFNTDEIK